MKARTFVILTLVSLGGFLGASLISMRLPEPMPEQAVAGKHVWQAHNCVSCHTLFGNGGYIGDDLTHISAQKNPEELINFFINPPVMRPNTKKLHPALTKDEALHLAAYLQFINNIPTLGWPPEPHGQEDKKR